VYCLLPSEWWSSHRRLLFSLNPLLKVYATTAACKAWTEGLWRNLHTVVVGILSWMLALWVDLCGYQINTSLIQFTCCSLVDGWPELLPLQR
jgi:hypothetical protein